MNDGTRIGVVLSSGGVRGVYAHTGFLLALEQLGLPISALVGCSAGAVVGGIAASGADLHAWSRDLARVKRAEFWTPDPPWLFFWRIAARRGRGYTGFSGTEAAGSFCRRHLAAERIEDCRYPFHTLAVNLGSGAKTMFSSGEMVPRILASAAMPVLYRPVNIEGELYCDGALLDLAPMDAVQMMPGLTGVVYPRISAGQLLMLSTLVLATTVLASVYPAWKAATLMPVAAIRGTRPVLHARRLRWWLPVASRAVFARIALRAIARNPRRAVLTLGALAAGLAAYLFLSALATGFFLQMRDNATVAARRGARRQ